MSAAWEPLSVERREGVAVVRLHADLDLATERVVLERVTDETADGRGFVVDLSVVGFMDSSGLRCLDRLARHCTENGQRLRLLAPPRTAPRRLLELTSYRPDLVDDDLGTALERLARPAGD